MNLYFGDSLFGPIQRVIAFGLSFGAQPIGIRVFVHSFGYSTLKQTAIPGMIAPAACTSRASKLTVMPCRVDHSPSAAATRSCGQPGKC